MSKIEDVFWNVLSRQFDAKLVETIRIEIDRAEPIYLRPDLMAADSSATFDEVDTFLCQLADSGLLKREVQIRCSRCDSPLTVDEVADDECYSCHVDLQEDVPVQRVVYTRAGTRSRDVTWVVTIHGMNTYGPWQEEFAWNLAQIYGYAVPVLVYKYGNIKFAPFLSFRQTHYRKKLLRSLKKVRDEMRAKGFRDRPDVIAHSFGTWLLADVLREDEDLEVGRVVLTGSIVRPDYPWKELIDQNRVESVLCHHGGKDFWAWIAHFAIPNSGPSGHGGFNNQTAVRHAFEKGYAHSDFFAATNLRNVMTNVWGPFLTLPQSQLTTFGDDSNTRSSKNWSQSHWRHITRGLLLTVIALVGLFGIGLIVSCVVGAIDIVQSVIDWW